MFYKKIRLTFVPDFKTEKMNINLHKADGRGIANFGWLQSAHTFSFGNYYNPERVHFGALRVINDDKVAGGMGFSKHPHNNMEIISIVLKGGLKHRDSMGNEGIISEGEIQVMSAGSGISHSEMNAHQNQEVEFLQIWVIPNKENVEPRYAQTSIKNENVKNDFQQIISPNADDAGLWIHQNAWFSWGEFEVETEKEYLFKQEENGLYLFVVEGSVKIGETSLERRDGAEIFDTDKISLNIAPNSKILLMEVPFLK